MPPESGDETSFEHIWGESVSELTAAHSTIEKAREVTNCPDGVNLQDHLKKLVAESLAIKAMNDCLSEELRGYESDGAFDGPDMHLLWWKCETQATDSILREAEARGVDAFTAKLRRDLEELDPEIFAYGEVKNALDMAITSSEMFARQLREGKAE